MSIFLTGEALKKETFRQLIFTIQKSSKKEMQEEEKE